MGLTISSRSIAEARIQHLSIRPVFGAYELIFGLSITVSAEQDLGRWATIAGTRVSVKSSDGPQQQVGFARPEIPIAIRPHPFTSNMTPSVSLAVQPQQVLALEEMRAGGDLNFELLAVGEGYDGEREQQIQDTWRISIPRSDWIEKMRAAGILDILLLEIPMPAGELSDEWAELGDHLMRAQRHFLNGEYFSCVSQCRLVVHEVGQKKFGKGEEWAVPLLKRLAHERDKMTKDEREAAIYAVLRHYTHQAHHSKSEGGEAAYTRSEAKMILSQTAALVAHARGI